MVLTNVTKADFKLSKPIDAMRRHNHSRIVFSSTAATYGIPQSELIDEQHQCVPINPYGNTKLVIEGVLQDYHAAYNIRSLSFRYFNACGAHPTAGIGERHDPETHLIPNVLKSLLDGGQKLKVFGGDYKTPDGSCVRDYVHVGDLCGAHLAAATYLDANDGAFVMNLGNGDGFSVLEIIKAVERVTGRTVAYDMEGRRPGDPPTLVANAALATESLNWTPKFDTIESIIETAWQFHQNT